MTLLPINHGHLIYEKQQIPGEKRAKKTSRSKKNAEFHRISTILRIWVNRFCKPPIPAASRRKK